MAEQNTPTQPRRQVSGLTRCGLRVTRKDFGFVFTVLDSNTGKQLGNALVVCPDAVAVAEFITANR